MKISLFHLMLEICQLMSHFAQESNSTTCLVWEFWGFTEMILIPILVFSSLQYWSNSKISGSTPYSFTVYPHWYVGTRRFLLVLIVYSSFCLGEPAVILVTSTSTLSVVLIWSGNISEKLRKSPDSSQLPPHSVGSVRATKKVCT